MIFLRNRVAAFIIAPLIAACVPAMHLPNYHPVERGIIATPDVTITAEDNSFTLVSGTEFKPPFQVDSWNVYRRMAKKAVDNKSGWSLRESSGEFLVDGARRVRINVAGKQFFGVLSLNMMPEDAYGPASRMYQIEIPQQYIDAASGGKISVVFETAGLPSEKGKERSARAWILWLSDRPLK